jgi:hypothetical protein
MFLDVYLKWTLVSTWEPLLVGTLELLDIESESKVSICEDRVGG